MLADKVFSKRLAVGIRPFLAGKEDQAVGWYARAHIQKERATILIDTSGFEEIGRAGGVIAIDNRQRNGVLGRGIVPQRRITLADQVIGLAVRPSERGDDVFVGGKAANLNRAGTTLIVDLGANLHEIAPGKPLPAEHPFIGAESLRPKAQGAQQHRNASGSPLHYGVSARGCSA